MKLWQLLGEKNMKLWQLLGLTGNGEAKVLQHLEALIELNQHGVCAISGQRCA